MDYSDVLNLLNFVEKSNFTNFEIDFEGAKIKVNKDNKNIKPKTEEQHKIQSVEIKKPQEIEVKTPMTIMPTEEVEVSGSVIKSPIVGTFYSSASPESNDFVKIGDKVKKGDVLCIIEAMKVMNEVTSTYDGEIVEIIATNEKLVEYNEPLFIIKEN